MWGTYATDRVRGVMACAATRLLGRTETCRRRCSTRSVPGSIFQTRTVRSLRGSGTSRDDDARTKLTGCMRPLTWERIGFPRQARSSSAACPSNSPRPLNKAALRHMLQLPATTRVKCLECVNSACLPRANPDRLARYVLSSASQSSATLARRSSAGEHSPWLSFCARGLCDVVQRWHRRLS